VVLIQASDGKGHELRSSGQKSSQTE